MSYGLQISASGMMSAMYRQDVFSNNLANLNTVGFKPDMPNVRFREAVTKEDGLGSMPSNDLLERLGGGTSLAANRVSFSQGPLRTTNNPLDVALSGDGFFVLQDGSDPSGDSLRFTRDGRFTRNAQGQLVAATSGLPVLDDSGRQIQLPQGPVEVHGDGSIRQGAREVAKLRVVDFSDRTSLRKVGQSMLAGSSETLSSMKPAEALVHAGMVEDSAVNEITALMSVTSASREVDANVSLMMKHDRMLELSITQLARVG
jgi:flagellar basal-body rod protein FlgF